MGKQRLTPWFPSHIKPVRVGEYNASVRRDPAVRRWWNGRKWSRAYFWPEHAPGFKWLTAADQHSIEWRGLASPPTKGQETKGQEK